MVPAIAIPALVALVIKFGLLCYSLTLATKNYAMRVVIALLFVITLHNLVEFVGLSLWSGEVTPVIERMGFAYVALLIPTVALILHSSLLISFDLPSSDKRVKRQALLYVPGLVLLYLLFATDLLVTGFQPFRNTLLRVPGPWYILFESYVVIYLTGALLNLIYGARESRKPIVRRNRNRLWLLAILPSGVLTLYLIIANHFGVAKLTSTVYVPIPLTCFLLVAAYATHQHRLIDVAFFVPGSQVRKRKTEMYRHVQALMAQISQVPSIQDLLNHVARVLHCPAALIGGPRPITAAKNREDSSLAIALTQVPLETLQKIDRLVVTDEIADSLPEVHAVMERHRVGAIVPFNVEQAAPRHWLVLGDHFNDQVYTPRDFEVVEPLFDRIGAYFLDTARLLGSQLEDASASMTQLRHRLALAWDELAKLREEMARAKMENRQLWLEKAMLSRQRITGGAEQLPRVAALGEKTLEQYLADIETEIVTIALKNCAGNENEAARLLGISIGRLRHVRLPASRR